MRAVRKLVCLTLIALGVPAEAVEPRVSAVFSAVGIEKVVLRASAAESARVSESNVSPRAEIHISGVMIGGAKGYHPADASWKETPPGEWGLEFVARRVGTTLVISSKNEIQYIHHRYTLEEILLEVPANIVVVREQRPLNGGGEPNLVSP